MGRDWLLPLALGLLAAGVAWWVVPASPDGAHTSGPTVAGEPSPVVVDVFGLGVRRLGDDRPIPVVALRVEVPAYGAPPPWPSLGASIEPRAPVVPGGGADGVGCDAGCLVPGKQPERVAADATAVGDPGVASVGATFYAFLGDGHLVMSNDAWHNVSRWSRRDFVPIETRAWYVGSGAPPANASLPSPEELRVAKPILDAMVGLPEGGVTSAVLDDPIVKDLFGGALYATVRIDELG